MKKTKSNILLVALVAGLLSPAFGATNKGTPEDRILAKGFAAFMDGRNKLALSHFEEAYRINPKNSAAKKGIEKVKVRLKKIEDEKTAGKKRLAKIKIKEGKEMLKTDDVVSAIDAFHAALDADPRNKTASSYLNKLKKKTQKTLKKKRFNLSSWAFARGTLAYLERDWAKSFRIWSQRAEIEPQNIALANAKQRAENKFVKMMVAEKSEFLRRGGREFYRQGLYAQARQSWEKLLVQNPDDQEALEGLARSEEALLRIRGNDKDKKIHDLLEQGLEQYARQNWRSSRDAFNQLVQLDPDFKTAKEYLNKINNKMKSEVYIPKAVASAEKGWRAPRQSNPGTTSIQMPESLENMEERKKELESQLKRDPSNVRVQQQLDKVKKMQEDESERIYKDGLIAYSQGNRQQAISRWKQVIVLNPDHKKAAAALRKARAEEDRTAEKRKN